MVIKSNPWQIFTSCYASNKTFVDMLLLENTALHLIISFNTKPNFFHSLHDVITFELNCFLLTSLVIPLVFFCTQDISQRAGKLHGEARVSGNMLLEKSE